MGSYFLEIIIATYYILVGFFILAPTKRLSFENNSLLLCLSFCYPIGYAIYFFSSLFSLYVFGKFDIIFALIIPPVFSIVTCCFYNNIANLNYKILFKVLAASCFFCLVLRFLNYVSLSYDSFEFVFLSKALSDQRELHYFRDRLSSYPFFVVPAHVLFYKFTNKISITFVPMFVFCIFFVLLLFLKNFERSLFKSKLLCLLFISLFICLISNRFFLQQFFYINGHTAAAYYFSTLLLLVTYGDVVKSICNISNIFCLFLTTLSFIRLESLFMILVILLTPRLLKFLDTRAISYSLICLLATQISYAIFISHNSVDNTNLISDWQIYLMLLPITIVIFFQLSSFNVLKSILLDTITKSVIVFFLSFFILSKPHQFFLSISNLLYNLLYFSSWGIFWILILFQYLIKTDKKSYKLNNLDSSVATYFIVIILLAYFRNAPYLVGWGDSANRMMIHIVPILIFTFVTRIVNTSKLLKISTKE